MKTILLIGLLTFMPLFATETKTSDDTTPFFNEKMGKALSEEFQRLRERLQDVEAKVTGRVKERADKGKETVDSAGKEMSKTTRKALTNLADELERTVKDLRKKAKE